MIVGVFFAALVIAQQASIFIGLMSRTYGFISDTNQADIWVMDSKVQFVDDTKPMQDTVLYRLRGVEGVEWAVPLYKGNLKVRLRNGNFQSCIVVGLDDVSLIGAPPKMFQGDISMLRQADSIIVDKAGAEKRLATPALKEGDPSVPLQVGDVLELNDNRAVVVGIANTTRTFQSQPVIYTTYNRAISFAPHERRFLSFVLIKAKNKDKIPELLQRIKKETGLSAYTNDEFSWVTLNYFLKNTGIPINFGIAVVLGFLVGTVIVGQTFYNFINENLRYFAALRAMGASPFQLVKMILAQASYVGFCGYGLGVGAGSIFYYISLKSELAFRMPWELLFLSAAMVFVVLSIAVSIALFKVLRLEPGMVFK